jgi:septal ring factor EnvC (AmiA/AmiB activator)
MAKKKLQSEESQQKLTPNQYYKSKLEADLEKCEKTISKLDSSISNHNEELKKKHEELALCKSMREELLNLHKQMVF